MTKQNTNQDAKSLQSVFIEIFGTIYNNRDIVQYTYKPTSISRFF